MASTYSTRISLEKQADGENPNTWGSRLNENVIELVDEAIAGFEVVSVTGPLTLTATQGTTNQARNFALQFAGTLTADTTVTIPAQEKTYFVNNNTSGDYTLFIKPAGGTAVSVVDQGLSMMMATDGSTIIKQQEVDLNVVATKIELAALSATLSSEIDANTSAIAVANTSIAANTSLITALSATLESRIASVSSTFAATSATLETRIATVSSTLNTAINNKVSVKFATSAATAAFATSAANADTLDGQHGSYYQNASNINAGTLASARLSGTYGISISGNAATASDAGLLDGLDSTAFLRATASSLSQNGYIKFSNNLIIQWGRTTLGSGGGTITWPVAFTTAVYTAIGNDSTTQNGTANMTSGGGTGLSLTGWNGDVGAGATYHWIAIGV